MKKYYFLSDIGKVLTENKKNEKTPRLDLESMGIVNRFESRDSAHLMRHVLEERFPRIFYEARRKYQQS